VAGNKGGNYGRRQRFFTFDRKEAMDATHAKVQEREELIWKFQKPFPWAADGEKWEVMDKIFQLKDYNFFKFR